MAGAINTFYTPEQLASVALGLVAGDLGIANTVSRSYEANFSGGRGFSVNVKRPGVLAARLRDGTGALPGKQNTAITSDAVAETVQAVTLDTEVYSAVDITDAELTLKIEDFARQVTKPQTDAIVQKVEALLAAALEAVTPTIDVDLATKASVIGAFSTARSTFRKNDVPVDGMVAVCGVDAYAAILDFDLAKVEGNPGASAAVTVPVRGFQVIEHNGIADDRIVFYHRDAFHLAMRAPVVPQGVTFGASMAANGVAMRLVRDYDSSLLVDRQVLNTYLGIDTLGVVRQSTGSVYVPALAADPDVS